MSAADRIKPWTWKPGQSGNLGGRPKKPRRSFDAVRRLEALHVDPLAEVVALAQDPELPKATRLKAWMALMDYAYPKLAPVVPNETVSTTLDGLQRSWDACTLDELKEAFRAELGTLPGDVRRELEELVARNGFDPFVIERLLKLKFIKRHTENQAQAPIPEEPEPLKLRDVLCPQMSREKLASG